MKTCCGISRATRWNASIQRLLRPLLIGGLLASSSGCLNSLLGKSEARKVYELPLARASASASDSTQISSTPAGAMLVERPKALPAIDSADLLVRQLDGELQLLPDARWSAPLPVLLQELLVRQIASSGFATSVSGGPQAYPQPLRLASELHSFELRRESGSEGDGLQAVAELSVRLVCGRNAQLLAATELVARSAPGSSAAQGSQSLRKLALDLAMAVEHWLRSLAAVECV